MHKLKEFINQYHSKINTEIIEEKIRKIISETSYENNLINNIKTAVSSLDLTTLEGNDTKDKVVEMTKKAIHPFGKENSFPHCAAVCVYPNLIKHVKKTIKGSKVKLASVATAFPSGQFPLKLKLEDVKYCIKEGADEIDMVISRGEFLSGNFKYVREEIKKVKKLCISVKPKRPATLKVILETGELGTLDNVRIASLIAISGGADFIKTSTGKIKPAATLPVFFVMCETLKDFFDKTGKKIGIKAAGGIRTTKDAIEYMAVVRNVLGEEWLKPELFRIGASSLLNDLISEYKKIIS